MVLSNQRANTEVLQMILKKKCGSSNRSRKAACVGCHARAVKHVYTSAATARLTQVTLVDTAALAQATGALLLHQLSSAGTELVRGREGVSGRVGWGGWAGLGRGVERRCGH